MKTFYFHCLIFFCIGLKSQPVLQPNNYLSVGMTALLQTDLVNIPAFGPGPNQICDLNNMSFSGIINCSVIAPASAPGINSFPNANYVTRGYYAPTMGYDAYDYENRTSTKWELIGHNIGGYDSINYVLNPKTELIFPLYFGNSFTDICQAISGNPDTITNTYDGYGTIKIGGNTYNNVVRIKSVSSLDSGISYTYYNTNPVYKLYILADDPYFQTGTPVYVNFLTTGISEIQKELIHIYPNPNCGRVYLSCDNMSFMHYTVKIFDVMGKQVMETQYYEGGEKELDIQSESGIYMVEVIDSELKATYRQKIVIQK